MIPPLKTVISDIGVIEIMSAKVERVVELEPGFYWTKRVDGKDDGETLVRYWSPRPFPHFSHWRSAGQDWEYAADEFVVIGERLEPPSPEPEGPIR